MNELTAILVSMVLSATPLLLAAAGELVTEKSGVLNLGVEGMMIVGAVVGFGAEYDSGSAVVGFAAAAAGGALLAALFGLLTLFFLANQVATGLALTIFGLGLSALIGTAYIGKPLPHLPQLDISGVSDLPVLGPLIFGHDAMVYLSVAVTIAIAWFLSRTRAGLVLRSVGENHEAAHALGYPVRRIRFLAVLFGGAMSGLGGAYLSLAYTPLWSQGMTAGRGWIALALVVFSTWKPWRLLFGAYLFGFFSIVQLHAQGLAVPIAPEFLSMLPYLATILVLVIISRDAKRIRLNAPASLGKAFRATA
jgi:general nucleoside transport system permease protein